MTVGQSPEQAGHQRDAEIGWREQSQAACQWRRPEGSHRLIIEADETSRKGKQHLALFRQPDAARIAVQKLHAKQVLKLADLKADRRRRAVDAGGSTPERSGIADGDTGVNLD